MQVLILVLLFFISNGLCEKRCDCYMHGTLEVDGQSMCNKTSGHCTCIKNVAGKNCDKCKNDFYGIHSGKGCEPCKCTSLGTQKCDLRTGECYCKEGFSGPICDKCDNGYYLTSKQCKKCNVMYISNECKECEKCIKCSNLVKDSMDKLTEQLTRIRKKLSNQSNLTNSNEKQNKYFIDQLNIAIENVEELKKKIKLFEIGDITRWEKIFNKIENLVLLLNESKKLEDLTDLIKKIQEELDSIQFNLESIEEGVKRAQNFAGNRHDERMKEQAEKALNLAERAEDKSNKIEENIKNLKELVKDIDCNLDVKLQKKIKEQTEIIKVGEGYLEMLKDLKKSIHKYGKSCEKNNKKACEIDEKVKKFKIPDFDIDGIDVDRLHEDLENFKINIPTAFDEDRLRKKLQKLKDAIKDIEERNKKFKDELKKIPIKEYEDIQINLSNLLIDMDDMDKRLENLYNEIFYYKMKEMIDFFVKIEVLNELVKFYDILSGIFVKLEIFMETMQKYSVLEQTKNKLKEEVNKIRPIYESYKNLQNINCVLNLT